VRIAAILHPYSSDSILERFRAPGVNLFRGNILERNDLPDAALVFGGDGSVHRLLNALAYSGCPVLVVPTGSGNDFAFALGIKSVADSLSAWRRFLDKRDNVRTIDLGVLTEPGGRSANGALRGEDWKPAVSTITFAGDEGRIAPPSTELAPHIMRNELRHAIRLDEQTSSRIYFGSVAGVGLDAATNEFASRMPPWLRGSAGYAVAALRALASHKGHAVSVRAEGPEGPFSVSAPALIAAFGNSPYFGNGMRILPKALLDDGLLDVCFVHNVSKLRVIREFPKLYSGSHVKLDAVEYTQAASIVIESAVPLPVCADGERVATTPVEANVARGALQVIVPGE